MTRRYEVETDGRFFTAQDDDLIIGGAKARLSDHEIADTLSMSIFTLRARRRDLGRRLSPKELMPRWSREEDLRLAWRGSMGWEIDRIASEIGRSRAACAYRRKVLRAKGWNA